MSTTSGILQTTLLADLERSGLIPDDLGAYVAQEVELAATGVLQFSRSQDEKGDIAYAIPYFDMTGRRLPFYRLKLLRKYGDAAYLQPQNSPSYVYYPKGFAHLLEQSLKTSNGSNGHAIDQPLSVVNGFRPAVIVVEGEKKAAKAVKEGFLCAALGGIYNWKSRTIVLPEKTSFTKDPRTNQIRAKLPSAKDVETDETLNWEGTGTLAIGLAELINIVQQFKMQIIICFDTDVPPNPNVQKAAATLAYELRYRGIPTNYIRQLQLPSVEDHKTGLDDYLVKCGSTSLVEQLHSVLAQRVAFPKHPNIRAYVNAKLQAGRIRRSAAKELALTVIADLDSTGQRMREVGTELPYYFDSSSKTLMPVKLMSHHSSPLHETKFGVHLYNRYDIGQGDTRILPWIATSYTGEEPITNVAPRSVLSLDGDNIVYQLNDGQYIVITPDPKKSFLIYDNGDKGLLFRSDQVEALDANELTQSLKRQLNLWNKGEWKPWWSEILAGFKFLRPEDRDLVTLIFYASPWLSRWRGTQLPIEMVVGEPGSGKSSLYTLRMAILTGRPALRNQPTDIRDWHASVTSSDGLHVTDNMHLVEKALRQRLSDEMCRLVTEPNPTVEMRALFTSSDLLRLPTRCTFALTSINQTFTNADILQRSVIYELEAVGTNHDNDWVGHHMQKYGGRAEWVAHHLVVLHQFLRRGIFNKQWDTRYKSSHRLVNLEQILSSLGSIIGLEAKAVEGLKHIAVHSAEKQLSEYDWTMQGLKEFAMEEAPSLLVGSKRYFTCGEIAAWAQGSDAYEQNVLLTNSHRLGRYIKSHKFMIERATGIFEVGMTGNRLTYGIKEVS